MTDFKPYEVIHKTRTIEIRSYYPVKRTVCVGSVRNFHFLPLPYMIFARAIYRINAKKVGTFFYNKCAPSENATHFCQGLFWYNDGPICLTNNYHYASPKHWNFKKLLEEFWFRPFYPGNLTVFGGSIKSWEQLTIKQVLKALERRCSKSVWKKDQQLDSFGLPLTRRMNRNMETLETLEQFIKRIEINQHSPRSWAF